VSSLKDLFRQERRAHREFLLGTVVSRPALVLFDGTNAMWVVDVDVGSARLMRDVPVKGVAQGGRFYADIGQTVLLRRNAQGRFDVVSSGDRKAGVAVVKDFDLTVQASTGTSALGFTVIERPFDFYQGNVRLQGSPYPTLTFDQVPAANDTLTRSAGSWSADGFTAAMVIRVANTGLNNGTRTILGVSPLVLTFAGDVLQDEGPLVGAIVAQNGMSRWADGVTPFPKVSIIDQRTGLEV